MVKKNQRWEDQDEDRDDDQDDQEDWTAFHNDTSPFDAENEIPAYIMNKVLDGDDVDETEPAGPAKGEDDQDVKGAHIPLQGLLSGMRDDLSVISSNVGLIQNRLEKLEALVKARDDGKQKDKIVKEVSEMLYETRMRFHEDMALFDKANFKGVFDGLDQKMRLLHQESQDRKSGLAEVAETVSAASVKWALVFSGIFSGLWTILMAIVLTIMK